MNVEEYTRASIRDLRAALDRGDVTAMQLLQCAHQVLQEKDAQCHAFIEVFASGEKRARDADARIARGDVRLLTGIPVALKDNFCVEGECVTAGSVILGAHGNPFVAPYSGTVPAMLEAQGAVLVGRTNMDEFAMGSSTEYSAYGPTKNPHDLTRVPGGSSGGSAAAVAMGAVPCALGSDTGGSVRQPASFCGVYGLKPTYGALSRYGLITLASSLDVVGLFTRDADDMRAVFAELRNAGAGCDSSYDRYAGNPVPEGRAKRIGVPRLDDLALPATVLDVVARTVARYKEAGYDVQEISIPHLEHAGAIYYIMQPAEASSNLARFDGMRYGARQKGNDVWQMYAKTRGAGFGAEVKRRIVLGNYVLSAGHYDAYYAKAAEARETLRAHFLDALRKVEVLLLPTTPSSAFAFGAHRDPVTMYAEDRLTLQANLVGLPALSFPAGFVDGLPIGMQCIGWYHDEATLCDYARVATAS